MLTRKTHDNRVDLPASLVSALGNPDYFDVSVEDGRIVLTPWTSAAGDAVRDRLAGTDVTEADVADAVAWTRQPG